VLLDILDDVFLLHLPLEAPESAFDRLALLNFHFSHENHTPFGWLQSCSVAGKPRDPNMLGYHGNGGF
jgi:hypothetical protein